MSNESSQPERIGTEITVALRVDNHEDGEPVIRGSETRECVICGESVFISPATAQCIADGSCPDEIWCVDCDEEEAEWRGTIEPELARRHEDWAADIRFGPHRDIEGEGEEDGEEADETDD